jgi:hypothetical protein
VCLGVVYELWLGPYTLGIGAFAGILAPEELHSAWVKDLLVVYIYIVYRLNSFVMPSESAAVLRYVKMTEEALSPKKGSPKAAGLDLRR